MGMKSALSIEDSVGILPTIVSYNDHLLAMNFKPMERDKRDPSWLGLRHHQDRIR
jgi:hypothetical protein